MTDYVGGTKAALEVEARWINRCLIIYACTVFERKVCVTGGRDFRLASLSVRLRAAQTGKRLPDTVCTIVGKTFRALQWLLANVFVSFKTSALRTDRRVGKTQPVPSLIVPTGQQRLFPNTSKAGIILVKLTEL